VRQRQRKEGLITLTQGCVNLGEDGGLLLGLHRLGRRRQRRTARRRNVETVDDDDRDAIHGGRGTLDRRSVQIRR
jgi:hypothetical protein